MLRRAVPAVGGLSVTSQTSAFHPPSRSASSQPRGKSKQAEDDEMAQARDWLKNLSPETIPERISKGVTVSSGSTHKTAKFQQRTPLRELFPIVPKPMHDAIRKHRYCSSSSSDLVITATDGSKLSSKKRECSRKLYLMLCEVGKEAIPPERPTEDGSASNYASLPTKDHLKMSAVEVNRLLSKSRAARRLEKVHAKIEQGKESREEHRRRDRARSHGISSDGE